MQNDEPEEEFCDDCGDSIGQEPWDTVCSNCRDIRDEELGEDLI